MFETFIRKSTPALLVLFTLALTVGTVFAQEAEESSSASGLALGILLLGLGAIAVVVGANFAQSSSDE